jgi:L-lactate dehydrogenase (cytochrome)
MILKNQQLKLFNIMSTVFTWKEIQQHMQVGDCWIVINGKVYDTSAFMNRHPGGRWIILAQAGQDATPAFLKTIHS